MARSSSTLRSIAGPYGLVISSRDLSLLGGSVQRRVKPAYADPAGVLLSALRHTARSFQLKFGGVLSDLPAEELPITAQGDVVTTYDTNNDNRADSFFFQNYTISFPGAVTVLGVTLDNVKAVISDLSNHPTLLNLVSPQGGASWVGSIKLSGSRLSLAAVPDLQITPVASGADAFSAIYDIASGDLKLDLSRASYSTANVSAALTGGQLKFENANKNISLKGAGELSIPGLSINKLAADLDVRVVNSAIETLKASIQSTVPIGSLGLLGKLTLNQNFKSGSGTIALTDGVIAGIKVAGNLAYTNSGNPAVDQVTGQLQIDNSVARQGFDFKDLPLSIVPLAGQVDYLYKPQGSDRPGGYLNFTNVSVDVVTGTSTLSFSGDMKLNLDANAKASLQEMNLSMAGSAELVLEGLGRAKLEPLAPDKPVTFSLKSYTDQNGNNTGLLPLLTGKLSFAWDGDSVYGSIAGLSYEPVEGTEPPVSAWTILEPTVVVAF